jgi:hypothetical protein
MQLVIQLEVACRQYLKDWVSIVFEEENIIIGLVFNFDICEALCSKQAHVNTVSLEAFD